MIKCIGRLLTSFSLFFIFGDSWCFFPLHFTLWFCKKHDRNKLYCSFCNLSLNVSLYNVLQMHVSRKVKSTMIRNPIYIHNKKEIKHHGPYIIHHYTTTALFWQNSRTEIYTHCKFIRKELILTLTFLDCPYLSLITRTKASKPELDTESMFAACFCQHIFYTI